MNNFDNIDGERVMIYLSLFHEKRPQRSFILGVCLAVSFFAFIIVSLLYASDFLYPNFRWVLHLFWIIPVAFWGWGIYLVNTLTEKKEISMIMFYVFVNSALAVIYVNIVIGAILGMIDTNNIFFTVLVLAIGIIVPPIVLWRSAKNIYQKISQIHSLIKYFKTAYAHERKRHNIQLIFIGSAPMFSMFFGSYIPNAAYPFIFAGFFIFCYYCFVFIVSFYVIKLYLIIKHKLIFLKIEC
ncbi:MAG: hypothetical protein FWE05_02670 [Defluviitaleaceae bacterium]|nr:hypothetical protein [Defluviitaleaceae bacterium]